MERVDRLASDEHVAEVRKLREEGASLRAIAAQVFGDERLKGRVERILAVPVDEGEPAQEPAEPSELEAGELAPDERLAGLKRAYGIVQRQIDERLARGEHVSPSELVALQRLELRLGQYEELEELRRLTTHDA
jgi:hypothetical protein